MQVIARCYLWKIVLTVLWVFSSLTSPIYCLKVGARERPADSSKKTVIVIDSSSKSREIIYDAKSRQEGKNNADEIVEALSPLNDKIQVEIELITPDWKQENGVLNRNPDLIIIHASAFYGFGGFEARRFDRFLNMIKTRTKVLIFSRVVPNVADQPGRMYSFRHNKDAALTFRDPDVRTILIQQVSRILGLRP